MAPIPFVFCFLSLVLTSLAAPWIVTEDYAKFTVTETPFYWQSSSVVSTTVEQITPTATVMPEPISIITSTRSGYYASDVTVVEKLYPTGAGVPISSEAYDTPRPDHSTVYYVNLVFSAPTSSSTHWTTTTTAEVTLPLAVASLLSPTSVSTSFSVDNSHAFQPTTYTVDVVAVDSTQIPKSSMLQLRERSAPMSRYSGSGCEYYLTTTPDSYYGYGSYGSGN